MVTVIVIHNISESSNAVSLIPYKQYNMTRFNSQKTYGKRFNSSICRLAQSKAKQISRIKQFTSNQAAYPNPSSNGSIETKKAQRRI